MQQNLANPSELAELIKTVAGLTRKIASIESEIQSLRQENAVLRAQYGTNRPAPVVPDSVVVQQNTSRQHSAPDEDADGSSSPNSERDTSDIDVFQLPQKYQLKMRKLQKKAQKSSSNSSHAKHTDDKSTPALVAHTPLRAASVTTQQQSNTQLRAATSSVCRQSTCRRHSGCCFCSTNIDGCISLTRDSSAKWNSYKLTIPRSDQDTVLNQSNWPEGIIVRPFRVSSGPNKARTQKKRGQPIIAHKNKQHYANGSRHSHQTFWTTAAPNQPRELVPLRHIRTSTMDQ